MYELPFGRGKAFLSNPGMMSNIARGWTVGGTFEYQPGALLNFGKLFFNGNLADIAKQNPEVALLPDSTLDPTRTWFNIAGFVTATADQPATFQRRTFPFRWTVCAARV